MLVWFGIGVGCELSIASDCLVGLVRDAPLITGKGDLLEIEIGPHVGASQPGYTTGRGYFASSSG